MMNRLLWTTTLSLVLGWAVPATAAELFADDFDGVPSPQWGNESGSWVAARCVYFAQEPRSIGPAAYSGLPFDLQDFEIELDVNGVQDGGIWLRSTFHGTPDIGVTGVLLVTGASFSPEGRFGFYWHIVNPGTTYGDVLNRVDNLFDPGDDIHVRVRVSGNVYTVFYNGIPVSTLTTNLFPSGRVALYSTSPPNVPVQTFDNVRLGEPVLPPPSVPPLFTTTQTSGPLREIDGIFEEIDLDGDTQFDCGAVIGVGRDFGQHYAFQNLIRNDGLAGDLAGLAFLNVITDTFDIDPTGEDEADVVGLDGNCDDNDCDGVAEDVNPDCVTTISGPIGKKNIVDPRYIVFEADTLAAGATCTPTVFVVTKQLSSGKGKKATQTYAPDACDIATTQAGGSLAGMITLNPGLSVIDRATNDLVSGPHGPILATPFGCP